jgi:predicted O-linked N-acetylglucosamine transferase (SPINDLY family)
LVDLAGHTGRHRLGVFARRPAPLQMTWIGYPSTTGLPAIDVLLADDVLVPVGSERYFSERIERLAGGHISYLPPTDCPDVVDRPESGAVVFGSFNKLDKTNREVLLAWAEILSSLAGSRLVLRSRGLDDSRVTDRVVGVLLDPFPFSGGLTTCEALWMGVPVVTWAGERMCGRQSASFLSRVGLGDLVGSSRAEYVSKAIGLAGDPIRRGALRAELRGRVGEGPLGDARRLANEFTLAVERSWLRGR